MKAGKGKDDPTLTYQVTKDNNDNTKTVFQKGDTVLEVAPNATDKKGEETLTFAIVGGVTYSGTYTGTVTFEVSVGDKTPTT